MKRSMIHHSPYTHTKAAPGQSVAAIERDHRKVGRASAKARRATATANGRVQAVDEAHAVHAEHNTQHDSAARAPWLSQSLGFVLLPVCFVAETLLGYQLGRDLFGVSDFGVQTGDLVLRQAGAFGVGAIFGLGGMAFAVALAKTIGLFLAASHGTRLDGRTKPGRPLAVVAGLLAVGLLGYYLAGLVREESVSTASNPVDAWKVGMLTLIVPFAVGVLKSHWYSREASVASELLERAARRAERRWSRAHARAERRIATFRSRRAALLANAGLIYAVQSTLPVENAEHLQRAAEWSHARLVTLVEAEYPVPELRRPKHWMDDSETHQQGRLDFPRAA